MESGRGSKNSKTNHMTSKQQQIQNNSAVDNDSQVERLSKTNPGPKAKLPAEGARFGYIPKKTTKPTKQWVAKQQRLWKEQFEETQNQKPDGKIWYKH
jgi:hypothetical protein